MQGEPVALLVNNLGVSMPMEMMVVARAALKELADTYQVRLGSYSRIYEFSCSIGARCS